MVSVLSLIKWINNLVSPGDVCFNYLDTVLALWYFIKVRIFKYPRFNRFAGKEGIGDVELTEIVNQLETGRFNADLGGGVYKVRVARPGEGKAGGYRVIVYFKNEFRTFFAYGFAKSGRGNIDESELKAFKVDARDQFALTDEQIEMRLKNGTLFEINTEACNEI